MGDKIDVKIKATIENVPSGEWKVWAKKVWGVNPDLKGGLSLLGVPFFKVTNRVESNNKLMVTLSGKADIGDVVVFGLSIKKKEAFNEVERIAFYGKVIEQPRHTMSPVLNPGILDGISLKVDANMMISYDAWRITQLSKLGNAFHDVGVALITDGLLKRSDYRMGMDSNAFDFSEHIVQIPTTSWAAVTTNATTYKWTPSNPAYLWPDKEIEVVPSASAPEMEAHPQSAPEQIVMREQKSITFNGNRITLPPGFFFVYAIDDIWLIGTTVNGKHVIGFVDLIADSDCTLSKTQQEFIEQQARKLEARAHTYRVISKAKSNGKE